MRGDLPPKSPVDRVALTRTLGGFFERERCDLGLSQEVVALNAGLAVITYGGLERGMSRGGGAANPTLETLLRVFHVLGITPSVDAARNRPPGI